MRDIYQRLGAAGFDRSFVSDCVLPEWWDDALATDPTSRKVAELTIAKALRFSPKTLADPEAPLALAGPAEAHFKKRADAPMEALLPAVTIARRVCELVLRATPALPAPNPAASAESIRAWLAARGTTRVNFDALLDYSWSVGVPVVLLSRLPKGAKRVDAMALLVEGRPVIALCSSRQSPAWLVWHLAHELGHVSLGHVFSGDTIDVDFGSNDLDERETAADKFAELLVHGREGLRIRSRFRLTGETLAQQARSVALQAGIDEGAVITNYAFTMAKLGSELWGSAQKALALLNLGEGGPGAVNVRLAERLDLTDLTESEARYLKGVVGLA